MTDFAMLAMILIRTLNLSQALFIDALLATGGSMPRTQLEYDAMIRTLRRNSHIAEGAPGNIMSNMSNDWGRQRGRSYLTTTESPDNGGEHSIQYNHNLSLLFNLEKTWWVLPKQVRVKLLLICYQYYRVLLFQINYSQGYW